MILSNFVVFLLQVILLQAYRILGIVVLEESAIGK
jgi:hypothetical protein